MKLFLCPNVFTEVQRGQALVCLEALKKQGFLCSVSESVSETLCGNRDLSLFPAGESTIIVSLGGDGAVLRAAQVAIAEKKPLIGITSGRLGFLCALDYSRIDTFSQVLSESHVSERTMLEFEYHSEKHVVLNDVVLSKHNFGSSVDLRVTIEDEGTYSIRGDGVVIATPTGSTAYNYSAGGPIMMESCDSIVITPVCAHHGTTRSLVVRGDKALKFSERDNQAMIFADGNEIGFIEGEIQIKRSNKVLGLYITDDMMGKIQ